MTYEPQVQHVVVTPTKSMGIAIILTVLFGPLGMLYSTIIGGVIMLIASVILGAVTFGLGLSCHLAHLHYLGSRGSKLTQQGFIGGNETVLT